jgi:hypothetical protein
MPELFPGELAPTTADRPPGPPPRPKLSRSERIPDPRRWRDVIPPLLAEQVADSEQLAAHRKLVERTEAASTKVEELRGAHKQAVDKDRQAERSFAESGGKLGAPTAPAAAEAVEQAERELELLERELPASADQVFAAAYPFLEQAAARLEGLLDEDDAAVEAAIGEALRRLDERAEVGRQAAWVGMALWEPTIAPFDANARKVASNRTAAELRRTQAELVHEREETRRKRFERRVDLEMGFNPDRSPKRLDGRSAQQRRAEAEQIVRQREAAER